MVTLTLLEHYSDKCNKYRCLLIDADNLGDIDGAKYFRMVLLATIDKHRVLRGLQPLNKMIRVNRAA